ncbi:PNGase F N-terminal domain-containing protein [Acetobacteroides hydrogenigenes]|uniref:Peptide-N-glycosidase F-like protein n=1 Tax=Acetobacteroides hydrogenigenes TaxID=979970 RepID=A0A4R2EP43_9BACT|nr:PNGase F N-terminal domain-containing protein [Acetobacteroides hydrogenigenes]TCN70623.1 peptide-N-glycosidase F-like protein [Acetobacteroides hydrogenigenes]
MKKLITLCAAVLLLGSAHAKDTAPAKAVKVYYKAIYNGQEQKGPFTEVIISNNEVLIKGQKPAQEQIKEVPDEATYIDYNGKRIIRVANLYTGEQIYTARSFEGLPKFEPTGATEKILGYTCKKYKASVFSNTIEIFIADNTELKGTPQPGLYVDGLVLKIVRNGNAITVADRIEILKKKDAPTAIIPATLGTEVTDKKYSAMVAGSFVKTVEVFRDEQICFKDGIKNPENSNLLDHTYRYAGGTLIIRKVKLPKVPADANVFAEVSQRSNGDAYDRTGSIFIIPQDKKQSFLDGIQKGINTIPVYTDKHGVKFQGVVATEEYSPIIELVRFFTPFGVGHFNTFRQVEGTVWQDSAHYKQDITELLPKLDGEVWIGAFIGNYDAGGHKLSLRLKYHLNEKEKKPETASKVWIYPLFATINVMEMGGQNYGRMFDKDTLSVRFNAPKGVKNVTLRYITTGHGGWGNGDEFVMKQNEIFLNGQSLYRFTPWRTDCGTHRSFNPASGNFWNGLSSSDLSRSGWCPGTLTNPVFIPVGNLKEGTNEISVYIPLGPNEGTSSSSWCISGILIGEME